MRSPARPSAVAPRAALSAALAVTGLIAVTGLTASPAHAAAKEAPAAAKEAPAPITRDYAYDTALVRSAAQLSWPKLGRSYFWNWFRCDSTRIFVPGEVSEAEDPLGTVCMEARDLSRSVQPVLLRVERTGVGRSRMTVGAVDPAAVAAVKAYVKTVDKAIDKADKANSPLHDAWFRALPSTLVPHARDALAGAVEDCDRRAAWLEKADPMDAATQRAIEGRIAHAIDSCSAAIAARRVADHPVDGVVRLVRSAADATVDSARAKADPAAIRATIARMAAYPAPVRDALKVETEAWVITATGLEADAAEKIVQARANLPTELKSCYATRERARTNGADLAMAVHAPAATSGQVAVWLLPGPLLETRAGDGYARVDDGQGGASWAVSLPTGKVPGATAHVVGTLTTTTVTTSKGQQLVPLLQGECYAEQLPQ